MGYLITGDYLLEKMDQPKLSDSVDWRSEFTLD